MYGKNVIYAKAKKAIHGTLQGAILAHNKLVKHMTKDWGFKPNHYNHCTMNKIDNGKQLIVVWHVNDLKILHKEQAVVETFIADLNSVYGTKEELPVNIGNVHNYLSITIDYNKKGKVIITMFDYIKQILNKVDWSNNDFSRTALTPATANISRNYGIDTKLLEPKEADTFHSQVARLLFLVKQARQDINSSGILMCSGSTTKCARQ